MLTNKVFVKKTKKGSVMKIVREHYLRDDITCGSEICKSCEHSDGSQILVSEPSRDSKLCPTRHYIVPDTNVVLHQVSSAHEL